METSVAARLMSLWLIMVAHDLAKEVRAVPRDQAGIGAAVLTPERLMQLCQYQNETVKRLKRKSYYIVSSESLDTITRRQKIVDQQRKVYEYLDSLMRSLESLPIPPRVISAELKHSKTNNQEIYLKDALKEAVGTEKTPKPYASKEPVVVPWDKRSPNGVPNRQDTSILKPSKRCVDCDDDYIV